MFLRKPSEEGKDYSFLFCGLFAILSLSPLPSLPLSLSKLGCKIPYIYVREFRAETSNQKTQKNSSGLATPVLMRSANHSWLMVEGKTTWNRMVFLEFTPNGWGWGFLWCTLESHREVCEAAVPPTLTVSSSLPPEGDKLLPREAGRTAGPCLCHLSLISLRPPSPTTWSTGS